MRGRPAIQAKRIEARASEMRTAGERVNKSRIARELHVPIRTVFRVMARGGLNSAPPEYCHSFSGAKLV